MVYKYGMRNRGCGPWCQPKEGFIDWGEDPRERYYNIITYNRPLSTGELREYELDELDTSYYA